MRKALRRKKKSVVLTNLVKHSTHFDDQSIREWLRNSYLDSKENTVDLMMEDSPQFLLVQPSVVGIDAGSIEPNYMQKRSDLSSFWNLFVQKQIFYFEQESFVCLNWNSRELR
jgi:hypothetical protein